MRFIVGWGLPAVWVALCPPVMEPLDAAARTRARLRQVSKFLHAYIARHKEPPSDINALRADAASEGGKLPVYDAWGARFDYQRLDDKHYLVRSFGRDGVQNHLGNAPDAGLISWGAKPAKSPVYKYATSSDPELYPAVLLSGSEPPTRSWLARLYPDEVTGARRLLVRNREHKGLFMVAPHDAVEEYFWLPDGDRIVFTATGSTRHRDGLFVWNLTDDSLVNLGDIAAGSTPLSPSANGGRLWLSLAGVNATGPTVHVYALARHDGPLDPRAFFDRANLVSFLIPGRKGETTPRIISPMGPPANLPPPFAQRVQLDNRINQGGGLPEQRKWLKLETQGELEPVLLSWHSFSETEHRSALFPYCLWILSGLYGETFDLLARRGHSDAEVLRTFGTEIARVLINDQMAPTYLKSLALFTYESLMAGERLPYHLADIKIRRPPPPSAPTPEPETAKP